MASRGAGVSGLPSAGDGRRPVATQVVPIVLLAVASLAVVDGVRLIAGGRSAPPGWYLCTIAVVFAVATLLGVVRTGGAGDGLPEATVADHEPADGSQAGRVDEGRRRDVWRALGLTVAFAFALPWLGFAVTNGLFTVAYLRLVAGYGLVRSAGYGLAIDLVAVLFFTQVGVQLPRGVIGL